MSRPSVTMAAARTVVLHCWHTSYYLHDVRHSPGNARDLRLESVDIVTVEFLSKLDEETTNQKP